jgi:tetratricopeptide (TPR) repeat protein
MGFFMRNFERQADLYSARVMGGPEPAISALEKIAFLSGRSRNVPSWHHFSIKQRVDCLLKTLKSPEVIRRHNRFIAVSLIVFFTALAGVGYLLNFSPLKQALNERLIKNTIRQQLNKDPRNILLLQSLAMVYQQMEKYRDAIQTYERLLSYDSSQPVALNNLAWLLVTVPDKSLRDPPRALDLAKKAVALERSPVFLDTLAEAYYVNGFAQQAVEIIKEAISLEKGDDAYYKGQLRKFMGGSRGS